jgi:hypothetical protein
MVQASPGRDVEIVKQRRDSRLLLMIRALAVQGSAVAGGGHRGYPGSRLTY